MAWEESAPRHWTGPTLIAAALMFAAPLWWVQTPAMTDYPAHLASFALIRQGGNAIYHLHWMFVPNLASEVLVPLLARLTGVMVAAKLFLTAAIFLWVLGAGAVHRALYGRTGIAPLFGAFFAYNANFLWGFFNYYFAAGLSLALFAGWIASDGEKRAAPVRLAGFTLAVTILYFCHIFAAASLLLMLAGYEAAQALRQKNAASLWRRAARLAVLYIPAALAFLFLMPHSAGQSGVAFNLADTMQDRFESLIGHAFDQPSDLLSAALLGGLALALVFGKARLHPAMWGVLALMLAGALLAPEWAMGGWAVHLRLPALFAILLFAATEFRMVPPLRAALAVLALAMIAATATALAQNWTGYDRQYREFHAALAQVPRGARLLTVLDGNAIGERADQPYWHMADAAITERDAFTPLLFTTRGQHVVQLNPPYDRIAAATAQQGSPPDVDELDALSRGALDEDDTIRDVLPYLQFFQCHFDMAVVVHLGGRRTPVPPMLRLRQAGSFFALYDVRPDKSCAGR